MVSSSERILLSNAALALFRLHVEHRRTIDIDTNREAYRELARAGLMVAGHSFAGGDESIYRLTKEGEHWVERDDVRSTTQLNVLAAPRRRIPVHDADRAARFSLEVLRKRRAADDPNRLPIPVEPDRRFPRPVFGVVSQVCVQRPRQELVEVENFTIPGRHLSLDDPHHALSPFGPFLASSR